MRHDDKFYDHWYLRVLASTVAIFCAISSARYVWLELGGNASVSILTQVLCFLFAGAAILYFLRPRLAHHTLLALTVFILLAKGPDGPPMAVTFWVFVAMLLVMPYLAFRRSLTTTNR